MSTTASEESDQSATDATPRLTIEVEWADIAKTTGSVNVVGHYMGVLPQNAELALDKALSGLADQSVDPNDSRLMLRDLTRRGVIRGALGEVIFFPWQDRGHVVLAGMGRLGTFEEPQLRTLAASLSQSVIRLFPNPTIATVLIGAGAGNLSVQAAVCGLIEGVCVTLANEPGVGAITLRIVEYYLDRAYEILAELRAVEKRITASSGVSIIMPDSVIERDDTGGGIPVPFGFSLMLASLAQALHDGPASPLATSADALIGELPAKLQQPVRQALQRLGRQRNTRQLGLAFRNGDPPQTSPDLPDRISFLHDGTRIHGAAITNLSTVSATTKDVSLSWLDRFVDALRAPTVPVFEDRGKKALQTLVHPSLKGTLLGDDQPRTNPLVLELDRKTARVPWELLHQTPDQPLAVMRPLARQLRTAYAPRPPDLVERRQWKALVIGDPDGTLEGAALEAKHVKAVLDAVGVDATLRLGRPDVPGRPVDGTIEPADLYEILELLQTGEYDLVHYAGHSVFLDNHPDRSGWVFRNDHEDIQILTASQLEGMERAPRLIVANACVSAALSMQIAPQRTASPATGTESPPAESANDAYVVAGLADEFFRRGVADYIGTAWDVGDEAAMRFAATLYREFFTDWNAARVSRVVSLGQAVQRARVDLFTHRDLFPRAPTVWAAFQHYGDPTRSLLDYRA